MDLPDAGRERCGDKCREATPQTRRLRPLHVVLDAYLLLRPAHDSHSAAALSASPVAVPHHGAGAANRHTKRALIRGIPSRRIAQPEDVANAVSFFPSPRSSVHHGPSVERQRWADDGGLTGRTLI